MNNIRRKLVWVGALLIGAMATQQPARVAAEETKGPTVFAAASLQTSLDAIAAAWMAQTGKKVVISYGSSGILAKQIQAGAPADVFVSADVKWMEVLAKADLLAPKTRRSLLGNSLVLIEPADAVIGLRIAKGFDLAGALGDGRLAVCPVTSCPAGIYAKQSLEKLGVYAAVLPRLVEAENVRAALLLVARGEAKFGIVYGSDAKAEPKVKVVGTFPDETHEPIIYQVAVMKNAANPDAQTFESFLRGAAATKIFAGQGFTILRK